MSNEKMYFMRALHTIEHPRESFNDLPEVGIFYMNEEENRIKGVVLSPKDMNQRWRIFGDITKLGKDLQLKLTKTNYDSIVGDVLYFLAKSDGKTSVEGKYKGYWRYESDNPNVRKSRARMVKMTLDSKL